MTKVDRYSQRDEGDRTLPEARNGTIAKIAVENFMCHDKLEMKFDNRINYFTGSNGSGKSAMMTALVVGLGGSSRNVDRGNSAAGLIKHGRNHASVTITLNNARKKDAFKYDVYGPKIIVIRTLRTSGGSYRICNSRGGTVSTKKEELDRIIECFKISIANPVCCMSQDMVKKFVRDSNPKALYARMAEGTGINYVKKMIDKNKKELASYEREIKTLDSIISSEEKELKNKILEEQALERKLEAVERVQGLQTELAWVIVAETDKTVEDEQKKMESVGDSSGISGAMEKANEEIAEIVSKREEKKKEVEEAAKARSEFEKETSDLRRKAQGLRQKKMEKENQIANTRSRQDVLKKSCDAILQEFERSQTQQAVSRLTEAKARKAELDPLVPDLERAVHEAERSARDKALVLQSVEAEQRIVQRKRQDLEQKRTETKRSIEQLAKDKTDALAAFPRPFRVLADAIKKAKFQFPPVGPLGAHMKLKREHSSWAATVDSVVGRLMTTYLCGSGEDAKRLNALVKDVFTGQYAQIRPSVVATRFVPEYNYASDAVSCGAEGVVSLLEALDVEDPVVTNALIDQKSAHQILLVEREQVAQKLLSDVSRVPKNCVKAYTSNNFEYHPAPRYKSYNFQTGFRRNNMLQISGGDALVRMQSRLEELESELEQAVADELNIRRNLAQAKSERSSADAELKAARDKLEDVQKRIRKLEYTIRTEESNAKQPSEVEARLDAAREEVARCEEALSALQAERDELDASATALTDDLMRRRDNAGDMDRIKELEDEVNDLNEKEQLKRNELLKMKRKSAVNDKHRQDCAARLKKATEDLKSATEKAERLGPRPDSLDIGRRNRAVVQRELDRCKKAADFSRESEESVRQKKVKLAAENDRQVALIETLTDRRKIIARIFDSQVTNYRILENQAIYSRELTSRNVADTFVEIAAVRNLTGKMSIDHDSEQMELKISTAAGARDRRGQVVLREDMASLSGGERSFTTIALLLAIWDRADTPFHVCDEFDVYLDTLSRKNALIAIHREARRCNVKQYFFLSPQDDSVIPRDCETTIHKMPAPIRVRNQ